MQFGPHWIIITVALILGGINLLFPARSAQFRRRSDPELEARLAVASKTGDLDSLSADFGFFRKWVYRDYFYPRGARLMALPYVVVAAVLIVMG